MLRLILCANWITGRDAVLSAVREDVLQQRENRILIVPELISHDMERRLCEIHDSASRFAQVLSFTRLARRVAEQVGSAARECLDNGGRMVAMAAAARQLHSRLKAYAAVQTKPEFLLDLVEAVDEFKRCCVTSKDLMAASAQTTGSLAQKLEELSLLLEGYDALCSRGKRDPRDQMNWLLEQLEDGDFGENHVFYVDGFPDFTRQHMAILEHLIRTSPNVTVSLTCDSLGSSAIAFQKAGQTALHLYRYAKSVGVEVTVENLPAPRHPLTDVCLTLFQGKLPDSAQTAGCLRVVRGESVYQECLAAADHVLKLVHSGVRFRQIGIVCGDVAAYSDTLRLIFKRSGIPLYMAGNEDILQKAVISSVLQALDTALGGFEQKDVFAYMKSVLSPLDVDSRDKLENYAFLWGISGSRWLQPWENHPGGLNAEWRESTHQKLEKINASRTRLIEPLQRLRQNFASAVKLSQQVQALYGFLEEAGLAKRLRSLAEEMDRRGDHRSAQILNQLWDILVSALEQMHDVLGETAWDSDSFVRLFSLLLGCYDVGTIPAVLDSVYAGPVSAMRCQQVKHLVVLGAAEGVMPGYGGANGVLSEQERLTLQNLGFMLNKGSMDGLESEFAEIYGAFCGAEESILVSCPAGQPSFIYRRLSQMAGGETPLSVREADTITDPAEAAAFLVKQGAVVTAAELGLSQLYSDYQGKISHGYGTVDPKVTRALYGDRFKLSASQIDKQANCRLCYFLRYGLRADERREATIDPAQFGTYVHAVLEETAREIMGMGGFHSVSLETTLDIARKHSKNYIAQNFQGIQSARIDHILARNLQELELIVQELWQELSKSEFLPVGFEVAFGEGQDLPAIDIPGKTVSAYLLGFVDRVDAWKQGAKTYFRVVDYKTGKKDFDYCDVINGLGLQMLLYLFALEDGGQQLLDGKPHPAGVQYFAARSPMINVDGSENEVDVRKARAKKWIRRGLVLHNNGVLEAMEPEGSEHRLSCKKNKDGEYTGDLATDEQFAMLRQYVFSLLGAMVDEIASGAVEPNPYTRGGDHNACAYCPYKPVCHSATVPGRRNFRAIDAEEFWDHIRKETDNG